MKFIFYLLASLVWLDSINGQSIKESFDEVMEEKVFTFHRDDLDFTVQKRYLNSKDSCKYLLGVSIYINGFKGLEYMETGGVLYFKNGKKIILADKPSFITRDGSFQIGLVHTLSMSEMEMLRMYDLEKFRIISYTKSISKFISPEIRKGLDELVRK